MSDFLEFFTRFLPDLMRGAGITLLLTAEGLVAGFVLGLLSAYARVYGSRFWRGLAVSYIELFRGTPLLMQLFIIYYGLPGLGITLSRELSAFLALGFNSGAYQAEYLRGSILAIGDGQMMAGRAIGMSRFKVIWHIILPQALRLAIPAWSNEPVSLLKSTAVVFLIAVPELMAKAKSIAAKTYDPIGAYLAVAIIYLAIVYLMDAGLRFLERAARIPGFEMEGKKA
ncbi:MAG TPA: amino acid ABC transporter permease [Anaerolineales bacterium]|jgi:polar amino acid transport system permease protein|nr:amino acid ABC transporter permease [Anaerolineales bacterium]